ncbi:MAG TPA: TIM-barrel domain-containing protein [Terriglobales bacterium]|nr:TIM-barrel domain-containing protein [Terriglobales bacterium]
MLRLRPYFLLCLVFTICSWGAATAFAQSCVHATGGTAPTWVDTPITVQTGTFTAAFDATPSLSNMNSVVGLSHGAGTSYAAFANLVAFNGTQGVILARNGGVYASQTNVPYTGGSTYHFRLVVNVPAHTYSIFVTPPGSGELTIGTDYAFRTEQNTVTSIDHYGVFVGATSGTLTVCNFAIGGGGGGGDFSLTATPASQSVTTGGSTTYTVTIGASGGFSGSVALSASGLPAGATASFNPASVSGAGSSTLTVTAGSTTGNSTITITGTSGTLVRSTTVGLSVTAQPDFSLTATPGSQTVVAGNSTSYTVNVGSLNGFSGTVTLTASATPGVTASLGSSSITGSGTTTLMVTTTASTPAGTTNINITGTSGSLTHMTSVSLTVQQPAQRDFSITATPPQQSVNQGASTSYAVSISPINGYTGSVTLSVSGLPSGVTGSFSTNPVSGGSGSSTLNISASSSAATGPFNLTIAGDDSANSLSHSTSVALTISSGVVHFNGNPTMPPKWAFGVLWGSYHNGATVLSDADQLAANQLGGDLYWVDSSWLSSSYTGQPQNYVCFQFDSVQFPGDPTGAKLMSTLFNKHHLYFGVWEWPMIDQGCKFYSQGVSGHFFVPGCNGGGWHGNKVTGVVNFDSPAAVTWWEGLHKPLTDAGLTFIKMDTGCNVCGISTAACRAAPYNLSAKTNGGRGFTLTHTQGASNSNTTQGMWTGDTTASFSGMQSEMSTASGLNNATHSPWECGDTGGYNHTPTPELYIRWLEYTTFTPCQEFFGAKTTSIGSRFPWQFSNGQSGNLSTMAITLKYNQLRYQLTPFRYSNALAVYELGPASVGYYVNWIGSTKFTIGPKNGSSQIFVQPVTASNASSVSVSLPAGNWINYWTGASASGTVTVATPIDQEPVFVKAGSIIPMGPVVTFTDPASSSDPMTLDTYPAGHTSYTLLEDDGITPQYAAGQFSSIQFTSDNTSGHENFTIGAASGSYAGMPAARNYILKINQQASGPAGVTRDGAAMTQLSSLAAFNAASDGWFFDASTHIVWVKFNLSTSAATSVALQ